MIPEPVAKNVRELPVGEHDVLDVLNREIIPTLRAVREALNTLLVHFEDAPVDVTGSRADPEQALANALAALDSLGLLTDSSTA